MTIQEELPALMDKIPELTSLLYDLDLMPEQVDDGSVEQAKMYVVAAHFKALIERLNLRK